MLQSGGFYFKVVFMRLSKYYLPTVKDVSDDVVTISHKLCIKAGLIKQAGSGLYNWMPIGLKVLHKIENIIREEMNRVGAIELLMPCIQTADLWKESGRYNDYGDEMLRIKDRGGRELLFGPTNEEMITAIVRNNINSAKNLPLIVYQIQWKFRDEMRPRFGLIRAREFLLKDAYSFDVDKQSSELSYKLMYDTYSKIFSRVGLKTIAAIADSGPIGGDINHEFHVLADIGENQIYYDSRFDLDNIDMDYKDLYAATSEAHDPNSFAATQSVLSMSKGIEVGHLFSFDKKYSAPMDAFIRNANNEKIHLSMGSYGIGVSRLVAAVVEAHNDENGIIWPPSISPFTFYIVNLHRQTFEIAERVYSTLEDFDVLFDDTEDSPGVKLSRMDLLGFPYAIIIGKKGVEKGVVELRSRKSGLIREISMYNILSMVRELEDSLVNS